MTLTKSQAEALRKWVDYGMPAHEKMLGVHGTVFENLWKKRFLVSAGFLVKKPSESGLSALAEYEAAQASPAQVGDE